MSDVYRILIVEDEILIADTIKRYLEKKGHEVVGIAISYEEAVALFHAEQPDLVLLDIRISGQKNGIDIAQYIQETAEPKPFIFLTSQLDSKSISAAKNTFPIGYLSKPIQKNSLYTTIEIGMHSYDRNSNGDGETIALSNNTGKQVVQLQDILFLQSDHIYVNVQLTDGQILVERSTLKELLEKLPPEKFMQTHRSFAINLSKVTRWDLHNIYVLDHAVPMSRSRRKAIIDALN